MICCISTGISTFHYAPGMIENTVCVCLQHLTQFYYLTYLQKRKLDAVYYYMRSLAASNPILTAKESLMSLFEEAKRKVWRVCP